MAARVNTVIVWSNMPTRKTVIGSGTIKPGMILDRSAALVLAHASAGVRQRIRLVAEEDELQGNDIDSNYASGAQVICRVLLPGDEANILLRDGQDIAIGDGLISNGDGTLRIVASGELPDYIALEALDLSATANTTDKHILVEACN